MSTVVIRLLGLLALFLGAGLVPLVGSRSEVSGRVGGIPSPATTSWAGALVGPREEEGIPAPVQPPPLPVCASGTESLTLPALARQAIAHYFATGQVLPAPATWGAGVGVHPGGHPLAGAGGSHPHGLICPSGDAGGGAAARRSPDNGMAAFHRQKVSRDPCGSAGGAVLRGGGAAA